MGLKFSLFLFLVLLYNLSLAGELYRWKPFKGKGYTLTLYIPIKVCRSIHGRAVLLFLSRNGKVYRKTLKGKPYRCKVHKRFRRRETFRVLLFYPSSMEVRDLGLIRGAKEKRFHKRQ